MRMDTEVILGKLKEDLDIEAFKVKKPQIYSKIRLEKLKKQTLIYTNRSDVMSYFIKHYESLEVYLKDSSQIIKDCNYVDAKELFLEPNIYRQVPKNYWTNQYYKKFIAYSEKKSPLKEEIIEDYKTKRIISKKEGDQVNKRLFIDEWCFKTEVSGQYIYSEKYVALISAIRDIYMKEVFKNLEFQNFKRYQFSNIISEKDYFKYDYPEAILHNSFCCNSFRDLVKDIRTRSYLEGRFNSSLNQRQKESHRFLNYNSCSGLWPALKDKKFDLGEGEVKLYFDCDVLSGRHEHGKCSGLERLEFFKRFETVFLSKKESFEAHYQNLKLNLSTFLKKLNIDYRIIKTGAWFNEALLNEGCNTLDFEANFDKGPLEIGNLSRNSTKFTKAYNIKADNEYLAQGCSGMGQQRLVYLFFIFNTFEVSNWPKEIRQSYYKYLNQNKNTILFRDTITP